MEHKTHYLEYNVGSFGILVGLSFKQELDPLSSVQMMALLVKSLALGYTSRVGLGILRIKTFLKCPAGYIKADITGVKREVFTESTIKRSMKRAELAVNMVAQGLSEEEAKTIVMEAMEKTLTPLNGRFSIIREHITRR